MRAKCEPPQPPRFDCRFAAHRPRQQSGRRTRRVCAHIGANQQRERRLCARVHTSFRSASAHRAATTSKTKNARAHSLVQNLCACERQTKKKCRSYAAYKRRAKNSSFNLLSELGYTLDKQNTATSFKKEFVQKTLHKPLGAGFASLAYTQLKVLGTPTSVVVDK